MDMTCDRCGAPLAPGHVVCPFCEVPYDPAKIAALPRVAAPSGNAGPTKCRRRDGHVSRNASAVLAGGHVTLSSGTPSVIAVEEILDVRGEPSFNGERYGGTEFVILRLRDHEVGLMMKPDDARAWLTALGKPAS